MTDRPEFKELLVVDVIDAIEAKRPSIFTLNTSMQSILSHFDHFPHRDEILGLLDCAANQIKKGLALKYSAAVNLAGEASAQSARSDSGPSY